MEWGFLFVFSKIIRVVVCNMIISFQAYYLQASYLPVSSVYRSGYCFIWNCLLRSVAMDCHCNPEPWVAFLMVMVRMMHEPLLIH